MIENSYNTMKTQHITLVRRLVLLLLAITFLAIAGIGCNTVHGFGKDVEKTGENIQDGTQ